ncbi:MAG: hypothetical protein HYY16_15455 [Planctomycetes bacterium]|nr:hypothetical protein [Planctomycetota bacterium]
MRLLARVLCVSMLLYAVSPDMLAAGEGKRRAAPMTDEEDQALAAQAAQTPELDQFEAGDGLGVIIGVLVIATLVAVIYFLIMKANQRSIPTPRTL